MPNAEWESVVVLVWVVEVAWYGMVWYGTVCPSEGRQLGFARLCCMAGFTACTVCVTLGFFFFEVGSLWYVHFSGRVGGGEVGRLEVGFCWLRVTDCLSEIVVGVGEDLSCRVGCVPEELKCL